SALWVCGRVGQDLDFAGNFAGRRAGIGVDETAVCPRARRATCPPREIIPGLWRAPGAAGTLTSGVGSPVTAPLGAASCLGADEPTSRSARRRTRRAREHRAELDDPNT